ncbi:hypothetical protein HDU86_004954 [Geranomyces michiganensis]|nr:hypothetical protein HDU86_004954 [Geranomyces michiganensis]
MADLLAAKRKSALNVDEVSAAATHALETTPDGSQSSVRSRPKRARSAYLSDEILLRETYPALDAKRNITVQPRPATFAARSSRRGNRVSAAPTSGTAHGNFGSRIISRSSNDLRTYAAMTCAARESSMGSSGDWNSSLASAGAASLQTSFSSEDLLFPPSAGAPPGLSEAFSAPDLMDISMSSIDTFDRSAETSNTSISRAASSESLLGTTKRAKIANEILESERRYVDSLLQLRKTFFEPLMAVVATPSEIIPKKAIQHIFSELPGLINVNTELRKQLENRLEAQPWSSSDGFMGDIFLNLAPYLKMYSSYVKNFNNALSLVTENMARVPAFAQFITKQNADPELKGLPLQSFLIMPVQRIPRYKMLLEDLLKQTDPEHPDYPTLQKSLAKIAEVAVFVNETIREHEMMQELIEVQASLHGLNEDLVSPARRLIRRGRVQKISRRRHHARYLILLSDFLIYASPGMLDGQYTFHRKLDLELCEVVDVEDTKDMQNIFQIVSPEKSFAMYAESAKEKQKWIHDIDSAARELRTNRSTLRSEQDGEDWASWQKRRKMHNYSAPVWMPDDSTNCCMLCAQEFSLLKRKVPSTIVGLAGKLYHFLIPSLHKDTPARACDPCYERILREGKLQVVAQPPQSPSLLARRSFDFPRSPAALLPLPVKGGAADGTGAVNLRNGARRVRPVSMAPNLWNVFGNSAAAEDKIAGLKAGRLAGVSAAVEPSASPAPANACSLCYAGFSWMRWRYHCKACGRVVCSSCTPKSGQHDTCDPCHRGISPHDVMVDPSGGGWSASPTNVSDSAMDVDIE